MAYSFVPPIVDNHYCLTSSPIKPTERPFFDLSTVYHTTQIYITLTEELHQWFLDTNIDYTMSFDASNHYECISHRIDIEDNDDAMLYKLTFGGK
jgi:hypothetical protein